MPFVEQEKYEILRTCRLHPDNDLFRDQERNKFHVDINEWKCGYCQKSFYAEKFLDQHFDNRHCNLLNVSHAKCLADLCGALHCDFVLDSKKPKSKCNPVAAAKNRHLCESLANSCFPINQGPSTSRLHELFLRQFCDAHLCRAQNKPFTKGGKKQSGVFYLAISILTLMLLPPYLLSSGLFVQKRNEEGNTRTSPDNKSWAKNKTLIEGTFFSSMELSHQKQVISTHSTTESHLGHAAGDASSHPQQSLLS